MTDETVNFGGQSEGEPPGIEPLLHVYQAGELTVVGFAGNDVPDEACVAAYREQLLQLLSDHNSRTLAFDLTGVRYVPSGMLGLLVSLKKSHPKLEIELYNPSDDVREVLEITKLGSLFSVREVDVQNPDE